MTTLTIACKKISGIGTVWIARTEKGIARIEPSGGRRTLLGYFSKDPVINEDPRPFDAIIKKLDSYARGQRVDFDDALDLTEGTEFQRRVWRAIARIPWGETRSYAWLAAKAGRPKAVRAAANACGANPVPIIIPCHRVIASNGSIGGFSSGLPLKRRLLAIEGIGL
ncbi:MAG: methylated-DNA--[protein]-cysteine S-methyltransferase [bacterium]